MRRAHCLPQMFRTHPLHHVPQRPHCGQQDTDISENIPQGRDVKVSASRFRVHGQTQALLKDERRVAIAVVGATGSGKTTFINHASGANLSIGTGLASCTELVHVVPPFELAGYLVTLIDTPGFDDTTRSDTDILKTIARFLANDFKRGRRLAGILYLHRISDTRMSGVSRRNFNMFKQLCGERTLRNVVIVTNMWGQVNAQTGEARETELGTSEDFFKPALDKGAKMVRYDNTPENALAILRDLLENEPLPLRIQTEIVEHQKHIWQTAAGEKIAPELAAQNGKHAAEKESFLKLVREEMDHQDEENRARVKKETGVLHAEIVRIRGEGARLAAQYDAEKHDMEQKMEEDHQAAEREAESQRREILDLYQRLQNEQSDSRAQREGLQRQLNEAVKCYERRGRGGCAIM
ncbi:hypothetical protein PM082_016451 [Marasmius tenuissimus]|nr:hypothetical protein PM082_016451 [Marasmius tenuissimus]